MSPGRMFATAGAAALLAGCGGEAGTASPAGNVADEARGAGSAPVALGLTEAELLGADVLAVADGAELGDVAGLLRQADGRVDRLLVAIGDGDPARRVALPVEGLTVLKRGAATDLVTLMTADQLAALPVAAAPAH